MIQKWDAGSAAFNDAGLPKITVIDDVSAGWNRDSFRIFTLWRRHQRRSDQGLADGLARLEGDGDGHGVRRRGFSP